MKKVKDIKNNHKIAFKHNNIYEIAEVTKIFPHPVFEGATVVEFIGSDGCMHCYVGAGEKEIPESLDELHELTNLCIYVD